MAATSSSPFLDPGSATRNNSLAIVQLSRDHYQPIYLHDAAGAEVDGYAEGAVLNTRFGSFPHSTLIGVPWGSQVRASIVDTGSRGRKRKRAAGSLGGVEDAAGATDTSTPGGATTEPSTPTVAAAETAASKPSKREAPPPATASSGFIHILPPTPEIWTMSLPHRTQVVYASDYSYILHRLRARPGTRIIEAGSGSGSFTHASARAVYGTTTANPNQRPGHVFSFEFHNERYQKMKAELRSHGLSTGSSTGGSGQDDGLVTLTNRDVYGHGFLLDDGTSPEADAVFLDLPAPWRALQHLTRATVAADGSSSVTPALNPRRAVHICTFSPCIEQVTRTVSMLRRLGWVDIDMVEIANKKILIYRERPELVSGKASAGAGAGIGGGNNVPAPRDVGEAVARLKAIETRTREYNQKFWQSREAEAAAAGASGAVAGANGTGAMEVDREDVKDVKQEAEEEAAATKGVTEGTTNGGDKTFLLPAKPWLDGRLTSRVEPEVKTHTSYLVFAVLPRAWTAEDEAAAAAKWPVGAEQNVIGAINREVRKEQKRKQMAPNKAKKKQQQQKK
ncbi:tRNA (adenine-N(1)-)-methyltransferase catalytic subunit trm61 [Sporothrix curviconia]|uniref:tRNA (adenine(58)-N(1))-methyltransferase catalytic subunit TRM61 n=1 Tax=Sporothrix curviconia TaxID=1260050 RepID=A0ABP0BCJ5_9PEZI